jgi:5'-nucleotidase
MLTNILTHKRNWSACCYLVAVVLTFALMGCSQNDNLVKIVILHTNDTHSHLDALDANHPKFPGAGGYARRAWLIDSIRQADRNVLVFDCGDFSQGTPYYNLFKGEPEVLLMSQIGYDAVTIGNHEFDYGLENLQKLVGKAKFPLVCANYRFPDASMSEKIKPFTLIEKEGVRIGVFGIGTPLKGLVPAQLFEGVDVESPLETANLIADKLKKEYNCHLVVCLSHLGFSNQEADDDIKLAEGSSHIDIIIGGHSHTPLEEGKWVKNLENKDVLIAQAGYLGVSIGKIDIYINKAAKK